MLYCDPNSDGEIVRIWAWPIKAHVVQTFNPTLLVEVEETT